MRTGIANLPLHGHHCPRWLFERMTRLSAAIVQVVVEEFGSEEVIRRLSDPFWFQALGCVVGFDWHSSGLTTVLCGALKEGLRPRQHELGLFVAGGKAMASRKTPVEIAAYADKHALGIDVPALQYASRMAAKVDNAAVQDGYQIYHHVFVFTSGGRWAVVQQGMNQGNGYARRYHWLNDDFKDPVDEPHTAVCGTEGTVLLNMVARESSRARESSVLLAKENPGLMVKELNRLGDLALKGPVLDLPARHSVPRAARIGKTLYQLYERPPASYEELLSVEGVGPATVRAFALVSEVIYGVQASRRDPVRYSFAHGGKDGHPFPVNRQDYDSSINLLETALRRAKLGYNDRLKMLRRLATLGSKQEKVY